MRAGLENTAIRRVLAALLLSGLLLVAGASTAAADGYDGYGSSDGSSHYGSTYPMPQGSPATPAEAPAPPVLARTGSDSGTLVAAGVAAVALGGGLILFTRRRGSKAGLTPA